MSADTDKKDASKHTDGAGQRFGSALRTVLFYLVLVAVPLGVYFSIYVDTREQQTEVRNFRALDAASQRLTTLITNMHKVAGNVPVGVQPDDLQKILASFAGGMDLDENDKKRLNAEADTLVKERNSLNRRIQALTVDVDSREGLSKRLSDDFVSRLTDVSRNRQVRLDELESLLVGDCSREKSHRTLASIKNISDEYMRDFRAIASSTEFGLRPLALRVSEDASTSGVPERDYVKSCAELIPRSLGNQLALFADDCETTGPIRPGSEEHIRRRLVTGPDGVAVEAQDCRPFSTRSPNLARALPPGSEQIVAVLDDYGVGVRASLEALVGSVAVNVAPLFDQYVIADKSGRVLYDVEGDSFRYQAIVGAPNARRARLDFVNHVDMRELVDPKTRREQSSLGRNLSALGIDGGDAQEMELNRFGIHSRVEDFSVGGINFKAFVHPFEVTGLEPMRDEPKSGSDEAEPDDAQPIRGEAPAVLFMIGIVNSDTLTSESVKLRLSMVANALLAIGVVFSCLPLLWLWTGGDRLVLMFRHVLVFIATGLTASVLLTLFVLHLGTSTADDVSLDRALEESGKRISSAFSAELENTVGRLALLTSRMVEAGESASRKMRIMDAEIESNPETDIEDDPLNKEIRRNYFCRPDVGAGDEFNEVSRVSQGRYPGYDLAFVMDKNGLMWQCMSHRTFDTRPLALEFRKYFTRPRDNQLWQTGLDIPGVFMDRVTSILDGTTETVISARPDDLCDHLPTQDRSAACDDPTLDLPSAATIGRVHSLEMNLLLPHTRFAVVSNDTGRTLFHSVSSRVLATNFVRETDVDGSLLALMDSATEGFVDLNYHGVSVRAFVQPLAEGIPWTLITYRDHELADTLAILTVSMSAGYMFGTLFPIVLVLVAVTFVYRRSTTRTWRWREILLSPKLILDLKNALLVLAGIAVVVILLCGLVSPDWAGAAGLTTMLAALIATVLLVRRHHKRRSENPEVATDDRASSERHPVVVVFLMVLVTIGILPTAGWYVHFRSELGAGVADYLRDTVRNEVEARCDQQTAFARRYKEDSVFDKAARGLAGHGWMLRDIGSAKLESVCDDGADGRPNARSLNLSMQIDQRDAPTWSSESLRMISTFSETGSDLAARSVRNTVESDMDSLPELIDVLLGDQKQVTSAGLRASDMPGLLFALTLGVVLLWTIVSSIADKVLGMRLQIGLLPPARLDDPPDSWNPPGVIRACVVHRSERVWQPFLASMMDRNKWVVRRAVWNGEKVDWVELKRDGLRYVPPPKDRGGEQNDNAEEVDEDRVLYVVAGLERFVVDNEAGDALLAELEKRVRSRSGVLIWSRVMPSNWLANLSDQVSGDLANVTHEFARTVRWGEVLGPFDVRRLVDQREDVETRFNRELKGLNEADMTPGVRSAREAMLREAKANPELLKFAASVVRRLHDEKNSGANLNQVARQRFGAGAASHFHALWSTSSREERLQLLAMARGGLGNPTQTAPLTSLANRGLIATDGILRLRSAAFGQFIVTQLDHDSLLHWCQQGSGNIWKSIWPPFMLLVVLAVAFFVSSTPEALAPLAAILAAGLGAIPVISSLMTGVQRLRPSMGDD